MLATVIPLMCSLAVDPATIRGTDVTAAIESLAASILEAHRPGSHWDPPRMPSGESTRQHLGGYTALATLALLTAGHDAQTPPLSDAIAWLETIEPDGTYAVAFRAQVWAALPDRYLPALQRDIDRLTASFHWQQGGWDYLCRPVERIPRVSPSTRHVAVLALHAAAARGLDVPTPLLERVEQATIASQHSDGGWSYDEGEASSGSMTSAGVFSLLLVEELLGTPRNRHAAEARATAMRRGLAWLDERFVAQPCPGGGRCAKFPQYWLYALERLALATGTRSLAGRDWLRDAVGTTLNRLCRRDAEGEWQVRRGTSTSRLRQRCFALMMLHRAVTPLACAHVNLASEDPAHAVGLVRKLAEAFEQQTTWQSIDMADPVDVWLESPMVIATGKTPPPFIRAHQRALTAARRSGLPPPHSEEIQRVRSYLDRGGLLVAVAHSGSFAASIRHLAAIAAPSGSWSRPQRDAAPYTLLGTPRAPPRIESFDRGGRSLVLLITGDPSDVLPNVWAMATERSPFPPRLDFGPHPHPPRALNGAVVFAGTPWEPAAGAPRTSDASEPSPPADFVPLAASHDTQGLVVVATLDAAGDWAHIERLLSKGRVVLLASPPGRADAAMVHARASGISLTAPHAAPWASQVSVNWRPFSRQTGRSHAGLDLRIGQAGEGELIVAQSDILHALLGRPTWGIHGHDTETVASLLHALAAHAGSGDLTTAKLPPEAVPATIPP